VSLDGAGRILKVLLALRAFPSQPIRRPATLTQLDNLVVMTHASPARAANRPIERSPCRHGIDF
jgi:hypothetical protein